MRKVREVHTINGRPKRIVTDTEVYDIGYAYCNNIVFDNAVIVRNKDSLSIRGRRGIKLVFKEVQNNVKGNAGNLGQISRPKSENRGCDRRGDVSTQGGTSQKAGKGETNRRGDGCSPCSRSNRAEDTSSGDSGSIRRVLLHLGCKVYNKVDVAKFQSDFRVCKQRSKNGVCVDEHSIKELREMTCLRSENGFVAVESNGNINSILRDDSKPKSRSFLRDLLINAIEHGGYKLDCFAIMKDGEGGLAEKYCRYGFIPVVKDKFNRDFAPDGWNYERDGEPDVVFMFYCGDSVKKMISKSNEYAYKHYLDYDVPYITDVPQYIKPSDDYDWDKDKDDLSTYSQALRYRDWKYEQHCKRM